MYILAGKPHTCKVVKNFKKVSLILANFISIYYDNNCVSTQVKRVLISQNYISI